MAATTPPSSLYSARYSDCGTDRIQYKVKPNENLYAAPQTILEVTEPSIPAGILGKNKTGWVTTLICGSMSLVMVLVRMSRAGAIGAEAWGFIDVVLMFGMAFGIYKKSRSCAVIMLLYYAAGKMVPLIAGGSYISIGVGLLFLFAFLQGMFGTFAFHKFVKESRAK
jgi:hypothetical protein